MGMMLVFFISHIQLINLDFLSFNISVQKKSDEKKSQKSRTMFFVFQDIFPTICPKQLIFFVSSYIDLNEALLI